MKNQIKKLLFLVLALFCSTNIKAQKTVQEWEWAVKAGDGTNEYGNGIVTDKFGNAYITGSYYNVGRFGKTVLTQIGNDDIFIAKIDSSGNWIWAIRAGGKGIDRGESIALDKYGNIYINGYFEDSAAFGNNIVKTLNKSKGGGFIAKLDTSGQWHWAIKTDDNRYSFDRDRTLSIDLEGNAYTTGFFSDSANFDTTKLISSGEPDIYVAKLDSSGKWQWAVKAGGAKYDRSKAIKVDKFGNVYITGWVTNNAKFGNIDLFSSDTNIIIIKAFVAKLDRNGKWLWVKTVWNKTNIIVGNNLTSDSLGNVYVTGEFGGIANFGNIKLTTPGSSYSFIAKLDSGGKWQWAEKVGSTSIYSITVDKLGNPYITGYFNSPTNFGNIVLNSFSGLFFIAKLNTNGKWQWAVKAEETNGCEGWGITVNNSGKIYLIGVFTNDINFDKIKLINRGGQLAFVAMLREKTILGNFASITGNNNVCSGSTQGYTANKGSSLGYVWKVSGGTILSGQGTDSVIVKWKNFSTIGSISVKVKFSATSQDSVLNWVKINYLDVPSISFKQDSLIKSTYTFSSTNWGDEFIWSFGDGLVDSGRTVKHNFKKDSTYKVTLEVIDANGCTKVKDTTVNVKASGTSGITNKGEINSLVKLYPNPATNYLIIESTHLINNAITITDISGRHLIEHVSQPNNFYSIDISSLSAGLYFININNTSYKFIKKI